MAELDIKKIDADKPEVLLSPSDALVYIVHNIERYFPGREELFVAVEPSSKDIEIPAEVKDATFKDITPSADIDSGIAKAMPSKARGGSKTRTKSINATLDFYFGIHK